MHISELSGCSGNASYLQLSQEDYPWTTKIICPEVPGNDAAALSWQPIVNDWPRWKCKALGSRWDMFCGNCLPSIPPCVIRMKLDFTWNHILAFPFLPCFSHSLIRFSWECLKNKSQIYEPLSQVLFWGTWLRRGRYIFVSNVNTDQKASMLREPHNNEVDNYPVDMSEFSFFQPPCCSLSVHE